MGGGPSCRVNSNIIEVNNQYFTPRCWSLYRLRVWCSCAKKARTRNWNVSYNWPIQFQCFWEHIHCCWWWNAILPHVLLVLSSGATVQQDLLFRHVRSCSWLRDPGKQFSCGTWVGFCGPISNWVTDRVIVRIIVVRYMSGIVIRWSASNMEQPFFFVNLGWVV